MLTSVEIHDLRGIRAARLDELAPLSILVGPNSAGKSTILDAILLGLSPHVAEAVSVAARRRPGLRRGAQWLFWRGSSANSAKVNVRMSDETLSSRTMRLDPTEGVDTCVRLTTGLASPSEGFGPGPGSLTLDSTLRVASQTGLDIVPPGRLPEVRLVELGSANDAIPLHVLYTEVVRQGRRTAALSIIRDVVANIVGLEILTEDDYPIVYLVFEDHAVPVAVAGDGVQALVRTCLELAATPGGIVLLEEPEVHQHPRAIWQTARAIWSAVSRGVQVVLSTHSLDLIDALLSVDAEPGALDKLALYRVILENGELKSSRLTGFQAAEARSIIEEDLR